MVSLSLPLFCSMSPLPRSPETVPPTLYAFDTQLLINRSIVMSPDRRVSLLFSFFMFSSAKRLNFVSGDGTPSLVRFEISGVLSGHYIRLLLFLF